MRMVMMVCMVFFGILYANTTIELKKGWQLVGVPEKLSDMSVFENNNVEIVWGFDGATQKWRGYSSDANITQKIQAGAWAPLQHLEAWQAVWVFSRHDWNMTLESSTPPQDAANNDIKLYAGWNLVEVPQQSVVSEGFFGDAVVWKYAQDQEWKVNDATLNFPSIDAITSSEGLWVKSETTHTIDVDSTLSKLHTFNDETSMLAYIRKMLQMQHYYPYETISGRPTTVAASDAENIYSGTNGDDTQSITDATSTNLQEAGVDEGDILKHDDVHLFSADNANTRIVVTSFQKLAAQDYVPLTQIDMNGKTVMTMYLQDDRLTVLSNTQRYTIADAAETTVGTSLVYDPNQRFSLDIFDVSDIQHIRTVASHEIEGSYWDSRLIEGRLFLISQFMPNVTSEYPKIYVNTVCTTLQPDGGMECSTGNDNSVDSDEEPLPLRPRAATLECNYDIKAWNANNCDQFQYDDTGAWKYDYDNPVITAENLTPFVTLNGSRQALVTPSRFYAPYKLNQRANITTISSVTITDGHYDESVSFLGTINHFYASPTSLYLVSSEYPMFFDYRHGKEQQMIYKFALGSTITYKGRGVVEGWMLNQFSMGEKDGYLRVATTVGQSWWNRETKNSVYILKNVDDRLQIEGTLSGLGKPAETIRAVRFMGDRGFVVTFEQTDPLYTLDLSDPVNPKKIGELSIPGFSRYLHVVDADRVLSIGRHADAEGRQQELQVQLFDISDFANPRLADTVQIGTAESSSEAEYNHKALAYRASDLMFGLPYQSYSYGINKSSSEHFGIYQIEGMQIRLLHTLTSEGTEWGDVGRGVIFDTRGHTYGALIKGTHMICDTVK